MYLTYLGHSCFKLQDNNAALITDPFNKEIGLRVPAMEADIVTVSHDHYDHNNIAAVKTSQGDPLIISLPGEYESKGIFVYGIHSFHDDKSGTERGENIIFRIEMDNISICHLGDLGHNLSQEILGKIEGVDVLLIPVGGKDTIGPREATQIINTLEPRIVIPMHFKTDKYKNDIEIEPVEKFLKEIGIPNPEKTNKLKLSKDKLPQGKMEIIMMTQ